MKFLPTDQLFTRQVSLEEKRSKSGYESPMGKHFDAWSDYVAPAPGKDTPDHLHRALKKLGKAPPGNFKRGKGLPPKIKEALVEAQNGTSKKKVDTKKPAKPSTNNVLSSIVNSLQKKSEWQQAKKEASNLSPLGRLLKKAVKKGLENTADHAARKALEKSSKKVSNGKIHSLLIRSFAPPGNPITYRDRKDMSNFMAKHGLSLKSSKAKKKLNEAHSKASRDKAQSNKSKDITKGLSSFARSAERKSEHRQAASKPEQLTTAGKILKAGAVGELENSARNFAKLALEKSPGGVTTNRVNSLIQRKDADQLDRADRESIAPHRRKGSNSFTRKTRKDMESFMSRHNLSLKKN